ncbi:MAG: response regulator [Phycisphaerales bacterium]
MNNQAVASARWSDKKIFTTGEAAEVCKVSQQTIIRCFDAGRLGGFRVPGSKFRRIPRAELIKFMMDNEIPIAPLENGPRRVLVVDDDRQILEVFTDLLGRDPRFQLQTAGTGYDAGVLVESFKPHMVVLDYMLPDINGNHVCKRIREAENTRDTKVIVVSGVVNQAEIDTLMKAGADEFVKKPFNVQHLMSRISSLLGV